MNVTRKVRRAGTVFSVLMILFVPLREAAARPSMTEQIDKAVVARDLILKRQYGEAETYLKQIVADWPDELIGYFGMLSLFQIKNLDNYDFRFDSDYRGWEDRGRDKALQFARNPSTAEAWDLLLAGATLNVTGFYRAHNRKWLPAMRDGSLGFHTFEKAYDKDNTLADALLGTGLYDYWRSYYTRKLRFLPFFADRRAEGKAALERAYKEARFTNVLADISLAFIDFQEKSFAKAVATMDRLLATYPQNTILRMLKGESLIHLKKYDEGVAEFEKILAIDPKITKAYLFMGLARFNEGKDKARAAELLQKFLDLEPQAPDEWRKLAQEKLKALNLTR